MTATHHLDVLGQTYTVTTNVGSGRIQLGYLDGPLIAMWDPASADRWVIRFEGFDRFQASGHAAAVHAQLAQFDSKQRGHLPASEDQNTEDLLARYLERTAQPPTREMQEKRARLLQKLTEVLPKDLPKK